MPAQAAVASAAVTPAAAASATTNGAASPSAWATTPANPGATTVPTPALVTVAPRAAALALFGGDVPAAEVLVVEDTEAGVASAKAAGMRVIALTRTLGAERLRHADGLIDAIRRKLMRGLLA